MTLPHGILWRPEWAPQHSDGREKRSDAPAAAAQKTGAAEAKVPPKGGATPPPQSCGWEQFAMIGAMFAILYFLMIRPGQKQEKALKAMRAALSKGDVVVTSSGLHGTVHSVDEQAQTVTIQTDPEGRNRLTFDMASIGRKVDRDAPAAKETKKLDNGKPT